MPDERRPMPPGEPGEEPDEAMGPGADRFERYLDALLGGERPSPDDVVDRDEAEMARLAAELSAAADPDEGKPDPAFLDQLRLRMRQADQGIATVQEPLPLRPTGAARGARDGHAAPAAAGRVRSAPRAWPPVRPASSCCEPELADSGTGSGTTASGLVRPETASGSRSPRSATFRSARRCASARRRSTATWSTTTAQIRALGAVCTHMGCTLQFRPDWSDLRCPCHGASFDLSGALANGRDRWRAEGPLSRRRHGLSDRAARPGQAGGQGGQRSRPGLDGEAGALDLAAVHRLQQVGDEVRREQRGQHGGQRDAHVDQQTQVRRSMPRGRRLAFAAAGSRGGAVVGARRGGGAARAPETYSPPSMASTTARSRRWRSARSAA